MSTAPNFHSSSRVAEDLRHMAHEWVWFFALGLGLCILGLLAIALAPITALATATVFGLVMIIAGVAQSVIALWSPKWSGVLLHTLMGVLYVIVGVLIVDNPFAATHAFALLVATFLVISGVFRIVAALQMRFTGWPWALLNGFVALLLGMIIWSNWSAYGWANWEFSAVVIGIFVGVEIIFNGAAWMMFGMLLRRLNRSTTD